MFLHMSISSHFSYGSIFYFQNLEREINILPQKLIACLSVFVIRTFFCDKYVYLCNEYCIFPNLFIKIITKYLIILRFQRKYLFISNVCYFPCLNQTVVQFYLFQDILRLRSLILNLYSHWTIVQIQTIRKIPSTSVNLGNSPRNFFKNP